MLQLQRMIGNAATVQHLAHQAHLVHERSSGIEPLQRAPGVKTRKAGSPSGGIDRQGISISDPSDRFEQAAERSADEFMSSTDSSKARPPLGSSDSARPPVAQRVATRPSVPTVQRLSQAMKDRLKLFEPGEQKVEPKGNRPEKIDIGEREVKFGEWQEKFGTNTDQEAEPPGDNKAPELPNEPSSETVEPEDLKQIPVEDEGAKELEPSNEVTDIVGQNETEPTGVVEEDEPGDEEDLGPRSFGSGDGKSKWIGKSLSEAMFLKERKNYYKKNTKGTGMAYAPWANQNVKYLGKDDRAKYELKIKNFKKDDDDDEGQNLVVIGDTPYDTTGMNIIAGHKNRNLNPMFEKNVVIFVMDVDGKIYAANEEAEIKAGWNKNKAESWRFNHSSFVKGKPVAAAGTLQFQAGVLKGVTDESGHYKPDLKAMLQVLRQFRDNGVALKGVKVSIRDKLHDAEELLERGSAEIALANLNTFSREIDDFAAEDDRNYRAQDLKRSAQALKTVANQRTGLVLDAQVSKLIDQMKQSAQELVRLIIHHGDEKQESPEECAPLASAIWSGVDTVEFIDSTIIDTDTYNAAREVDSNLEEMVDDNDDEYKDELKTQLTTLATGLNSAKLNPTPQGTERAMTPEVLKIIEDRPTLIPYAVAALEDLDRGNIGNMESLWEDDIYKDRPDIFAVVINRAAQQYRGKDLGGVVDWIKDALDDDHSEPHQDNIDMMNALISGSGDAYKNGKSWEQKGDED